MQHDAIRDIYVAAHVVAQHVASQYVVNR